MRIAPNYPDDLATCAERAETMEDAVYILGADHVAWIKRQPHPAATASSRAAGEWFANNLRAESAYHVLERELRASAAQEGS